MTDVTDLLGFAIDKNPTDFASKFDELVREKAAIALENKKNEMAQSIYGASEDEDLDEVDLDAEDSDTDDDFEDDDFDIDLDDLDLDDLDLDDLDGDDLDD